MFASIAHLKSKRSVYALYNKRGEIEKQLMIWCWEIILKKLVHSYDTYSIRWTLNDDDNICMSIELNCWRIKYLLSLKYILFLGVVRNFCCNAIKPADKESFEKTALKNLNTDKDIILPADKGNVVVIMDTNHYKKYIKDLWDP